MATSRAILCVMFVSALFVNACKKDEEPQTIPTPSATPTAVAVDTAAATDTAATPPATPTADPNTVAPTQTTPVAPQTGNKVAGQSIDSCCQALSNNASFLSGKSTETKNKSATAAQICRGIAGLVKEGKTSRAAAMAQIKSAMGGITSPAECN